MTDKTDTPLVLRDDNDNIAYLTLNRPGKFNALSLGVLDALTKELQAIGEDNSVHVVVIQAGGKAFSAGHDLKEMRQDPSKEANKHLFDKCSVMMKTVASIPQPVIAKVQGIATAAGCQLVGACDLAIASNEATFATSGINLGLFCSTPSVTVSRNLPRKVAFEMLVTGEFITAEKAVHFGFINQAVPAEELDTATDILARRIAEQPAISIAYGKNLFYRQLEASLGVAYDMASETMACNMMTEDAQAGIDAFINKQPSPDWKGK
ncbi:MAG: enoyl-CoA hydratase [Rhodospirillales bacterium]|nr:enoyl-CoA hydratase [Rhodospirillales bacterium]